MFKPAGAYIIAWFRYLGNKCISLKTFFFFSTWRHIRTTTRTDVSERKQQWHELKDSPDLSNDRDISRSLSEDSSLTICPRDQSFDSTRNQDFVLKGKGISIDYLPVAKINDFPRDSSDSEATGEDLGLDESHNPFSPTFANLGLPTSPVLSDSDVFEIFAWDAQSDTEEADSCDFNDSEELLPISLRSRRGTSYASIPEWTTPADSGWKNEVAQAMVAFRTCREDDLASLLPSFASPATAVAFEATQVPSSSSVSRKSGVDEEQLKEIYAWRNDFHKAEGGKAKRDSLSGAAYRATPRFKFP